MLAISSSKIYKYKYLKGAEILLSDQRRMIKQAKFIYFPLQKAFEKQWKTIEDAAEKQRSLYKL